ncbi:class D beta-lactamase [Rhizobium sp.]|jgi:beta-lactamase class D|uniref:class D beta-lactamase n=1 Tax=Rhizobium sp. TaxID=391 RepID=UPI000E980A71|nr:class D beta-lactamase [Rhizobium sp.]
MENILLKKIPTLVATLTVLVLGPSIVHAKTLCTVVIDSLTATKVIMQGECNNRVTPASTFKISLAAMGYNEGILKDAHNPIIPFRDGYPDWGGPDWKQPTDPERWLKYSVVWYSQQITHRLGAEKLADYVKRFDYGNADVSGDPGKNNGLERAWIASSLKISPFEQVRFLSRLLNGTLPISNEAMTRTIALVETLDETPDGWTIHGKTGTAYPRRADGSFDQSMAWGWYVGWAEKDGHCVIFARLIQDEKFEKSSAGVRARESLLKDMPRLLK